MSTDEVWKNLVKTLRTLEPFDFGGWADRLHNKLKWEYNNRGLFKYIESAPTDPDDHETMIDGVSAMNEFRRLGVSAVADCVSRVDDDKDFYHYKAYIAEENAVSRFLEVITNLMPFCLGDHVDRHLDSKGLPNIDAMIKMDGFQDIVMGNLTNEEFIKAEIQFDESNESHLFSISMILLADYLQYKPGALPGFGPAIQDRNSYKILQAWSHVHWESTAKSNPDKMDQLLTFCGNVSNICFCPESVTGLAQPMPTFDLTNGLYKLIINSTRAKGAAADSAYVEDIQASLTRLDASQDLVNEWKTYCETLEAKFRTLHIPKWQAGVDAAFSATDWHGVSEWAVGSYQIEEDALYYTNPMIRVFYQMPPDHRSLQAEVGSYCIAGTQITKSNGQRCSIDEIKPGTQLLGALGSSEQVGARYGSLPRPMKTRLIGFNGENPFTIPAQVFHTSTGLRAVDPKAASKHNPYVHIGQLAIGHVLYKLGDNSKYDLFEIESIEQTESKPQLLYSLSLEAERQPYHANGYLVSANSPASTLKATAAQLQNIPQGELFGHLAQYPELIPLFRKFDQATLRERIQHELKTNYLVSKDRPVYQKRVNGIPMEKLQGRFALAAHNPAQLLDGYQLPELSILDGCIIADGEVQPRTTFDAHRRTFRWTRKLRQPKQMFEHGLVQILEDGHGGPGVVYLTSETNPTEIVKDSLHTFRAHATGSIAQKMTQLEDQTPGFHKQSTFTTTFDRNPWPADGDSIDTVNAMAGLEIDYGVYITEEGYQVATVRVPLLDELQHKLNENFDKQLDPLYRATCTVTKDGLTRANVQFHHSQLIPFISSAGLDVKNVFDVEFAPEVGMTSTLPALFQELYVDLDFMLFEATGALYEYNPHVRGMKGERHRITGESSSARKFFNNMRAQVSHTLAPYSTPDISDTSANPERQPAAITEKLYGEQENDITDLITLIGYDDQDIHNASQGIIHDMMFYHMNEDDRKNFTSRSKPSDLPSELADGLAQELKDFLRDKYAPAYLCRSFAASEHYESKFTDKERKKLWYWWEGNGDKCLSRSKEYNNINNLASIQAMKQLHGPVLNQFLADGPDAWAEKILSALQAEPIMDYYMANPILKKQNRINKQCCIMNTLSPLTTTADEWSGNIMIYAHKVSLEYPCIKEDNETAEKWLRESLTSLIVGAISGDNNVPSGVRSELLEDIKEFEDANSLDQSNSAEQRAAAIVDKQSAAIEEAKTWITGVDKDVESAWIGTRLYQWLGKAWESIYDKVKGTVDGSKVLKGLYTSALGSFFIGLAMYKCVGLIQDWNTLDDAKRSQVILETLKAVNNGVEGAIESWKAWKGRMQSVNLDQVDVAAIDQGVYRALDQDGDSILSMADEVNGEGGWHQSVAEHVGGDGVPTGVEEGEQWNQALDDSLDDIPPGGAKTVEEFSMTTKVLRGLNAILGLGVAVAMTFSLIREWDHLDTKNKIINTLVLVTQVLTVILDIANLGEMVGLWTITGTLGAALPIIGAVLVVVGIILALISYLVNLFSPPSPPPPDPVEEYINDHGKTLIDGFTDAPDPKLSYDISTDEVDAGSTTSITITATNKTSSTVSLADTRVTLLSGDDDNCLFSDPNPMVLVAADDASRDTSGHVYVAPADEGDGTLPPPTQLGYESQYFEYGLKVAGQKDDKENILQKLILQAGKSVKTVWTAKVSSKTGRSNVDVVENWGDDKSHVQIPIHRV